jgi:PAS domain S-box-containing protein
MEPTSAIQAASYLQDTMDNMFIHCFIIGFDWTLLYTNNTKSDNNILSERLIVGADIRDLLNTDLNNAVYKYFQQGIEQKSRTSFRAPIYLTADQYNWFRFKINPIDIGLFVVASDISDAIAAQNEVKKHKDLLETAEQISQIGSWEWDVSKNQMQWSKESYRILELDPQSTIPSYANFLSRVHPDDITTMEAAFQTAMNDAQPYDFIHRLRFPDGRIKYIHERGAIYYDTTGAALRCVGSSQDISEQVIAEQSLQKQKLQYQQVVDNISDGLIVYNTQQEIEFVNKQLLQIYGISHEEIQFKKLEDFVSSAYKEPLKKQMLDRIEGKPAPSQFEYKAIDGQGKEICLEARVCPIYYAGVLIKVQIAVRDITATKRHEQKLLEQNAELKKINFELDRFVYSASHDLRSPLLSMLGLIDLCEIHSEEQNNVALYGMMRKNIERLDNAIKSILQYSESARKALCFEPIDIKALIHEEIELQQANTNKYPIELHIEIAVAAVDFVSDKIKIQPIIKNILSNAFCYQRAEETKKYIKISFSLDNNIGTLIIEDNGEGIATNKLDKIFDMFYRNSEQSEGIGLGLYICKESIHRLGGSIQTHSILGKGTTFTIRIPNQNNFNQTI